MMPSALPSSPLWLTAVECATGCLPNKGMAQCLKRLEAEVRASGETNAGFKANAFRKAASVIGTHPDKLPSAKEAGKLAGVGKGVMALIEEYLETGVMGAEKAREKKEEEEKEEEEKEDKSAKENGGKKKSAPPVKQSAGIAFL